MSTHVVPAAAAPAPAKKSERELLEAIAHRLDHMERRLAVLDQVGPLVELANQFPGLIAMATDVVDEKVREAQDKGFDLDGRLAAVARLVERLTMPETLDHMTRMLELLPRLEPVLDSGVVAPEAVEVIAKLGEALTSTIAEPNGEAGLFRAWRASRTPDVRRALDFLLRLAGHFGGALTRTPTVLPRAAAAPALPGAQPSGRALPRPTPTATPRPEDRA